MLKTSSLTPSSFSILKSFFEVIYSDQELRQENKVRVQKWTRLFKNY